MSPLFLNRSIVIVGMVLISSALCAFSALSATEPPKSYIDLNPVMLNPAQAPLTKSGMSILSSHEQKYKENLPLTTSKAATPVKGQKRVAK